MNKRLLKSLQLEINASISNITFYIESAQMGLNDLMRYSEQINEELNNEQTNKDGNSSNEQRSIHSATSEREL